MDELNLVGQIGLIAGLTLLIMVSPGPDMVVVLRNTINGGRSAGWRTSLGVLGGNLIHISYSLSGVGWLIARNELLFQLLQGAAAVYLIYLGVMSLRAQATPLPEESDAGRLTDQNGRWFWQGFFNNVLNPKGVLFYLGVLTAVISPQMTWGRRLILVLTMMGISTAFWVVFVWLLDQGPLHRWLGRWQIWVNRLLGCLLIGLAIRLLLEL